MNEESSKIKNVYETDSFYPVSKKHKVTGYNTKNNIVTMMVSVIRQIQLYLKVIFLGSVV